jgi:hypothetical protein
MPKGRAGTAGLSTENFQVGFTGGEGGAGGRTKAFSTTDYTDITDTIPKKQNQMAMAPIRMAGGLGSVSVPSV